MTRFTIMLALIAGFLGSDMALADNTEQSVEKSTMLGVRTVIYEVPDMETAIAWYSKAFEIAPYYKTPEYTGFNIRGYELGLMPRRPTSKMGDNVLAYWGVDDIDATMARLKKLGATDASPIMDVGGGIRLGSLKDPFGTVIGLIYNPVFTAEE